MTESVGCELRTRPSTRTLTCCFLADRPKKEIDVGPPSWIRPLQLSGCAATVLASWIGFATCVLCSAPCFRAMDLTRARENSYMGTRRLCNFLRILADVYILAPRLHKAWPQAWRRTPHDPTTVFPCNGTLAATFGEHSTAVDDLN